MTPHVKQPIFPSEDDCDNLSMVIGTWWGDILSMLLHSGLLLNAKTSNTGGSSLSIFEELQPVSSPVKALQAILTFEFHLLFLNFHMSR